MASERPAGDWRHQGGGKRPPTRGGTSRRAWQPGGEDAKQAARQPRSPWVRRIVAGLVTVTLLGVAIWLIWLFWPARYPELALDGINTDDGLALPENPAGFHAAQEAANLATGGDRPKLIATPALSADADGVKIAIDPNPKSLVIYLSANGGADAAGPYLWVAPPKAASAVQARKVPVREILARIAEKRRDKPTLLVFDSTRVPTSWPH